MTALQQGRKDVWEVGDECVVLESTRVWSIAAFLGTDSHGVAIADLVPVGFTFNGTHSCGVDALRTPPPAPKDPTP